MLTQAAPAIVQALAGVLPDAAVKQLTQALGNCVQPLTHRGDISIQPTSPPGGKLPGGLQKTGGWNPNDYPGLLPNADEGGLRDMPGYGSNWNTINAQGSQFFFPTDAYFTSNYYMGGPSFYAGGNSYFDQSYVTNLTSNSLFTNQMNAQYINNYPVEPGPAGPPGLNGDDGRAGPPGAGARGFQPKLKFDAFLDDLPDIGPAKGQINIPANAITLKNTQPTVSITSFPLTITIPASAVTFDPELCEVSIAPFDINIDVPEANISAKGGGASITGIAPVEAALPVAVGRPKPRLFSFYGP